MKELPIGIQDFEVLRSGDHLYVDKTKAIMPLLRGRKIVFLSRPRRFGKSLLLSTLQYLFQGRKDLFEGLYIYDKIDWVKYPVIRLDFSQLTYQKGIEAFEEAIQDSLELQANVYGLDLPKARTVTTYFVRLINHLYLKTSKRVVLLIDEYDKPIVDLWEQEQNSKENQELLAGLFGAIKGLDSYLKFVMFTGITKVAKLSLFSKLNNVRDISLDPTYNTLLGITQPELESSFQAYFPLLQQRLSLTRQELLKELKTWYNGYSWTGEQKVYNPFGLLHVMEEKGFSRYWFSSGTPNFLINRLKDAPLAIEQFEHIQGVFLDEQEDNWRQTPIITLLFQTGYLTITNTQYDTFGRTYTLSYPNNEVRLAFMNKLLKVFSNNQAASMYSAISKLKASLVAEDMPTFINVLKTFYAQIPYHLHVKAERLYHALFLAFMKMLGMDAEGEVLTNMGRIDSVIKLQKQIYIIEFKYAPKGTPLTPIVEKALQQIEAKQYAQKYQSDIRKLLYMGIAFDGSEIAGKLVIP